MAVPFVPTPDVSSLLHLLLDVYERRGRAPHCHSERSEEWRASHCHSERSEESRRAVRVHLDGVAATLPTYYSQTDPLPRTTANEQLAELEKRGLLRLAWQPGQQGHLLEAVTLAADHVGQVYALLGREPLAERCRRLGDLLLGDRFRLDGWRARAVERCLVQLKADKSPAPFDLDDDDWNQDLLAALLALPDDATEEIPYRVFSVRVFNDSKRFDALKGPIARLARQHQPAWRALSDQETLRELGLVANPGHLLLSGPWWLADAQGQMMSLAEFSPSVGIPNALAARLQRVLVEATRVICVENLTSFYELARRTGPGLAALCLWGNPSPASRHLLRCLAGGLSPDVPLLLWADVDCGGLSILAQLRQQVSPRFAPYRMDCATLDAHARWAHPLSPADERNLARLRRCPALSDVVPLMDHMLARGIKLEQEAVVLD